MSVVTSYTSCSSQYICIQAKALRRCLHARVKSWPARGKRSLHLAKVQGERLLLLLHLLSVLHELGKRGHVGFEDLSGLVGVNTLDAVAERVDRVGHPRSTLVLE